LACALENLDTTFHTNARTHIAASQHDFMQL